MSWSVTKFENLYAEPLRNGIYKSKEFHGAGTKIVNMGELFNFDFISSQEMLRIKLTESELEKNILDDGDLIFGRRSVVESGAGKCSIVLSPSESLVFESSIIRVRLDKSKVNPLFYFYWFKSPRGRAVIKAIVTGANVKGIKGSDLRNILVDEPPKKTQDIIADSARNYDLLIQTNQQRIALLEEAAQRLYDEWFVKLRFPNHEQVPVVEGVPEGWTRGSLYDFANILSGGTPKTTEPTYWDGDIPFFTPKDSSDNFFVLDCEKNITQLGLKNCNSRLYEKGSIFITARGTVGKVCLAGKPMAMNQSCYAISPKNNFPSYYFHLAVKNSVAQIKQTANGGVFDAIIVDTFKSIAILRPNFSLARCFSELIAPLYEQVLNLIIQNQKLTQARDELLPRLMSGQLDISKLI